MTLLLHAVIIVFYVVGVLVFIPHFLTRRMLSKGCYECDLGKHTDFNYDGPIHVKKVRGEYRERLPEDVGIAIFYSFFWPIYATVVIIGKALVSTGAGIWWLVEKMTPLTGVERLRQEQLRLADIEKNMKEINT
jgi:hypothetical protein